MRRASITEAKNRLSALLDLVRAGESILIVDRGIPVARLEPAISPKEDPDGRLARLERSGVVRIGRGSPPVDLIRKKPPKLKGEASVLKALIDERIEGR